MRLFPELHTSPLPLKMLPDGLVRALTRGAAPPAAAVDVQDMALDAALVAGEKCFVDYCGQTIPVTDRHTGEIRQAQIFVGVMGASNRRMQTCLRMAKLKQNSALEDIDFKICHNRPFSRYAKFRVPSSPIPVIPAGKVDLIFYRCVAAQNGGNITFNLLTLQGKPVNLNEGMWP